MDSDRNAKSHPQESPHSRISMNPWISLLLVGYGFMEIGRVGRGRVGLRPLSRRGRDLAKRGEYLGGRGGHRTRSAVSPDMSILTSKSYAKLMGNRMRSRQRNLLINTKAPSLWSLALFGISHGMATILRRRELGHL